MATLSASIEEGRFERLMGFLARDPRNPALLLDTAEAAFDAHKLEQAARLLHQFNDTEEASDRAANLGGLVSMRLGRPREAVEIFERLLAKEPADEALRLNLAWAQMLDERYEAVLQCLEGDSPADSSEALRLRVKALHHLGRLDEAVQLGEARAQQHGDDKALMGALASVALDAGRIDLSQSFALLAGDQPDGLAALGMASLGAQNLPEAAKLFDQALTGQPDNARATIGRGLTLLEQGDAARAADYLERGAELFRTHLGSWIAAGWAHFIAGDNESARADFDRAMHLDPNFSECHGGLAVLAISDGQFDQARESMRIALRLDGNSLGGRLAQILLLERAGQTDAAAAIRQKAIEAPIGLEGQTIGQALLALARRHG